MLKRPSASARLRSAPLTAETQKDPLSPMLSIKSEQASEKQSDSDKLSHPSRPPKSPQQPSEERSKPGSVSSDLASVVSNHYNSLPDRGLGARSQSNIYFVRQFNNWTKSILIQEAVARVRRDVLQDSHTDDSYSSQPHKRTAMRKRGQGQSEGHDSIQPQASPSTSGLAVLDVACGKGGDLLKWNKSRISRYVGLDIAQSSIEDARIRYSNQKFSFKASFHSIDCFRNVVDESVIEAAEAAHVPMPSFHIVSCMFALHYAFDMEDTAKLALRNIAQQLVPGGIFIATIPVESWLIEMKNKATPKREFGNSLYLVKFDALEKITQDEVATSPPVNKPEQDTHAAKEASSSDCKALAKPLFKTEKYHFTLQEAVKDCPEYTVPLELLQRLASEVGLELEFYLPFHAFYERFKSETHYANLLKNFRVIDELGHHCLNAEEWEAVGIYAAVMFVKKSTSAAHPPQKRRTE